MYTDILHIFKNISCEPINYDLCAKNISHDSIRYNAKIGTDRVELG